MREKYKKQRGKTGKIIFLTFCAAMAGTLYTYPDNFRAYKVLIAAEYSEAKVNCVCDPPDFVLGKTNKTDEFLSKFPLGKVPAFEAADGTAIYESNAIAYYVASPELRGTSDRDAALVQQYVNFADNEILPQACVWVFPTLGLTQYNKEATRQAQENIKTLLRVLNSSLETRTFLVGERVTLADITVCCNLLMLYQQVLEPKFRAEFVHVNRWFVTCINQPQFKSVLGDVTLCEKMAQFDVKKYQQLFPKDKKKPAAQDQQQKPKPAQPKAEPKPAPPPAAAEEEEDDTPKPAKSKDPYADLPPSPFVMDEFKRCYSNEDTATKAIPFFWEKFDPEGYSIWRADYKFKDELKMIFMCSNLVSGMFQRIDKLRKTAFASILILGENNNAAIEGIWVFRGQELAFSLNEDWNIDAPSYEFQKLDPANEEHRQMVNKYLLWEGDFGGKEVQDGKIFK